MTVDDKRIHTLTKFSTKRGVKSIKKSDHNLLILEINLKWSSLAKTQRIEIYNYKNEDDFKNFQSNTETNEELLKCFVQFSDLNSACNKWLRVLNQTIRKSFKKIPNSFADTAKATARVCPQ